MHYKRYSYSLGIGYILLSTLYKLYSDQLVFSLIRNREELALIESYKGIAFFIFTGTMLILLTQYFFRRIEKNTLALAETHRALNVSEKRALAGILSASIAHDCNNLLTVLAGRLDPIFAELELKSTQEKNVLRARGALEKISELLLRLRDVGKSSSGSDRKEQLLGPIIDDAIHIARHHKKVANCILERHLDDSLKADVFSTLLHQAIVNILINAGEAIGAGGKIMISLQKEQEDCLITIEDNGPGIPEEQRQSVLEPFFTTKATGTGLGLMSLKSFVELHNGKLLIKNSIELGGAHFEIRIPQKVFVKKSLIGEAVQASLFQ